MATALFLPSESSCCIGGLRFRVCMRHLWESFRKSYPGDFYERVIWTASRSFCESEYARAMIELRENGEEAYIELSKKNKDKDGKTKWIWSRCDFSTMSKNHYTIKNISESYNAWVIEARALSVCDRVDNIRAKLMMKMEQRRRVWLKWKGKLTPMAERYLVDLSRKLSGYTITRAAEYKYEASEGNFRKLVDLEEKTCTWIRWQMTGLRCAHAMAILSGWRHNDWDKYVDVYFHKSRKNGWQRTYPMAEEMISQGKISWLKEIIGALDAENGAITRTLAKIASTHKAKHSAKEKEKKEKRSRENYTTEKAKRNSRWVITRHDRRSKWNS